MADLKITSPVFSNNETIPTKYTADGENISPPLNIEGVPEQTQSLVIIVDDPDAPAGTWTHWVVFNIDPKNTLIAENNIPGMQGMNDFKQNNYGGPSPPSGIHRYFFKVYALDIKLDIGEGALLDNVKNAMNGHILAEGEIVGKYTRE